ncbi:2-dehydro-3-deoxygalactonokinase [Anaerotruncus massiliensis (ex Liu et al. 2021)]|uniref:2-dehydro-3-deoxygalactonokinase n=3 Tax=Anaerotruncus TaxID=244127 RepID=A0A498CTJ9_9FIRM|nr:MULTISPECIES: 2-dehydro-3-deoxygalactonokinase [Anaerotruncus]MBC3937821.1 2-dehydro-3-deoxygalactonokinase [Anaerotruncus massiliensis (ex Togo et al. 2019)]RLL13818.1 2-dehydro-3-deoxygalactonokinase [Anaerotruncus massiliensis (ex Liu et al. 2021)]
MERYILTIDSGTSNTRAVLWDLDRHVVDMEKSGVGVRCTAADGHNGRLKEAVRGCLEELLRRNAASWEQVERVMASGMITADVGLVEVPHVTAPAGLEELSASLAPVLVPDVCPLPIHFIPGVKNRVSGVSLETFEAMDIMRGEEVEACALIDRLGVRGEAVLVLPGSHTKFVCVGADGRITGCLTTITGELLASIMHDTIIADSVKRTFVEADTYRREMVLRGYRAAREVGLSRACFSGRILNQFAVKDHTLIANFILGAALQNDLYALRHSTAIACGPDARVIVAGKSPFREAFADLMEREGCWRSVRSYEPEGGAPLSALGAYLLAEASLAKEAGKKGK